MNEDITRAEWEALTPDEQFQWANLLKQSDNQLRELLNVIPECPLHGPCIPHAHDWIRDAKQALLLLNVQKAAHP
jgi:hypothetical protein